MTKPILDIQHLTIDIPSGQYINRAVDDISFKIYPGQTYALVGESGSGKSVTALSIMQLLPPEAFCGVNSRIFYDDQDILSLNELELRRIRGRKIGMVFQEPMTALNPVLTIGYQIAEVLSQHLHLRGRELAKKSIALLEQVGLATPAKFLKRYPHQLSGGQRQRVAIAIALAGEPDLLIADEPTTALDVTIQAQILNLLAELQQQRNMGLLLITHDLAVVSQLSQEVGVMHLGKLVEQAPTEKFFRQPEDPYSQKLFAAANLKREPRTERETPTLLKAKNLHVNFKQRKNHWWEAQTYLSAVDGITLDLQAGKTLALVGESGSGKTTLAKALLRLVPMSSGNVELYSPQQETNKINLQQLSPHEQAKWLQIVWQDPYSSLDPRQSIKSIIAEALAVHGHKAITEEAITQLLTQVGLPDTSAQRYPHQFSGGQRQRIAIARALAAQPKIIICDEPTSALDVSVQAQVLKLLRQLQEQLDLAYLLITHNMSVVEYLADTVAVMYLGKIVEYGPIDQILKHPQHAYTKTLLSSIPKLPE